MTWRFDNGGAVGAKLQSNTKSFYSYSFGVDDPNQKRPSGPHVG